MIVRTDAPGTIPPLDVERVRPHLNSNVWLLKLNSVTRLYTSVFMMQIAAKSVPNKQLYVQFT